MTTSFLISLLSTLAFVFGIYVVLTAWFFAYTKARELYDAGVQLDWVVKAPMAVFLGAGFACDVVFNAVYGSILFRELPQEWTFSHRIKRWYEIGHPAATIWRRRLNSVFPGHI